MTSSSELDAELVDAIHRSRLSQWARETLSQVDPHTPAAQLARTAIAACDRISAANEAERARLVELLDDASIEAQVSQVDQRLSITVDVAPRDAPAAAATLAELGYRRNRIWVGGAERSFWRRAGSVAMTRSSDATAVVRLRWRATRGGLLGRVVTPTAADWDMVTLPAWAWWAYPAVRLVRLALERLSVRSSDHGHLEPFLVTPTSLLEPLLDVGCVGADDVLFDFGCGDGRFLVAAASSRRCRAIGVEVSAELAVLATDRVAAAGLGDRVRVVHGDGSTVDITDVTVVVLFLPMVVASRVVPALLGRLPHGARVVLHEQSPPAPGLPRADRVVGLVTDDAVTVAHRWDVRRER